MFDSSLDTVRLIARRRPLTSDRLETSFQPGASLAEMLHDCGLDPDVVPARVVIDGRVIESASWEHVIPRGGELVTVRVIPQGGGQSKDILRIVALVGILALSIVAPPLLGLTGALAFGATAFIGIGGSLGIRTLLITNQSAIQLLEAQ